MIHYRVEMVGGHGGKSWQREATIEAENFGDAYTRAVTQFGPRHEWDFTRIEEVDPPIAEPSPDTAGAQSGETHQVFDPFDQKAVDISSKLTDRLRGKYAVGPTLSNGEPEFGWRQFETPPIQHEAAAEIERLHALIPSSAVNTGMREALERIRTISRAGPCQPNSIIARILNITDTALANAKSSPPSSEAVG